MTTSQIRAIVRGRVQGVYFRASTREEAVRLGLCGYAQNLPDGSVAVLADGPEEAITSLLEHLHRGPRHARVDGVEWERCTGHDAPRPFEIR